MLSSILLSQCIKWNSFPINAIRVVLFITTSTGYQLVGILYGIFLADFTHLCIQTDPYLHTYIMPIILFSGLPADSVIYEFELIVSPSLMVSLLEPAILSSLIEPIWDVFTLIGLIENRERSVTVETRVKCKHTT